MDPKYTCSTCAFYGSAQSPQSVCKFYSFVDIPKLPTDFCGQHSQYSIDKGLVPTIKEENKEKKKK